MRSLITIALCALLLSPCGIAQAQNKALTKPQAPAVTKSNLPTPKKITSVEGITEYRLHNGLKVLLFPDPSKPTITVNITYLVGSRHEGYGESGMAHLLEHMVFKGSTRHPNIPAELTSHGASPNGTTWYDRTNYFETFAASDENLNWALDLESDRMINSFIKEEDLRSEFSVVRNEFEMGENSPSGVLMERILSTAYLWHNYGKSTIGSKEDIELVPIENLKNFYKKYYQPDNAVLVVAGKIDETKTLELVNQYFGVIEKPKRQLVPTYTVEPVQDGERFVDLRRSGDVQTVAVSYHIPPGSHPDYPAIDVLNEVLTNEPSGRLYQSLIKPGKSSVLWGWAASLHDPGFMYINADVLKEKSLDDAKNTLFATLDDLKTKPVTDEELKRGKDKLLSDFEKSFRNSASVGILLSEFIAQGDWRLGFLYRDALEKVNTADVNRVANKYFVTSNRTYGTFVPSSNSIRAEVPHRPNLTATLENYKGRAALSMGEAFDPSPANIDLRSELVKMPSGAKYYLLQKATRGNTVETRITMRIGDEASLFNKSNLAYLTAAMLQRGTRNKSMAQINETLSALKSTLQISGNGQNILITSQSTKENLPKVLALINEILHEPAFAPAEYKTLIDETISNLEQERSDPQSLAFRELSRLGNPYKKGHVLYASTVEEDVADLKTITLEEIRQFHQDYYNGSSTTAAIVGDFNPQEVKQHLDKLLLNWTAIKSFSRVADPFLETQSQMKEVITPDKKNAMMAAAMEIKMSDLHPDYPALTMANFIFGGGFLNSRLATRIRQKEGLSYGVGSFLQAAPQDDKTTFGSYAIYNPENKAKLLDVYQQELKRLVEEGISETELAEAKKGLLQYRQNGRANDGQLASLLNSNAYLGRQLALSQQIDDKLLALTVAEVNAAIKKYVQPNKMSFVMAGDFK